MVAADVGDDVYGDDKTTAHLEARVADMLGKAAGLFLSSGTQSNLIRHLMSCSARRRVFCLVSPITPFITKRVAPLLLVALFPVPCPLMLQAACLKLTSISM